MRQPWLAMLLFACNTGLLASAIARRAGGAGVISALWMAAWTCWMLPLHRMAKVFLGRGAVEIGTPAGDWLAGMRHTLNPFGAIESLLTPTAIVNLSVTCGWLLGGGLLAFLVALVFLDQLCAERPERQSAPGRRASRRFNDDVARAAGRRPGEDAVVWRDFHFIHGGPRWMGCKIAAYLVGLVFMAISFERMFARNPQAISFIFFLYALTALTVETAYAASRIYRIELREKTLSALFILPQRLEDLMRAKNRALRKSLTPAITVLVLSIITPVGYLLGEMVANGEAIFWFAQGVALLIAQYFFVFRLVVWFSLRMKWGGLPTALAIVWFGNTIAITICAFVFREAALIVLITATIIFAVRLKYAIRHRLISAAAAE